mmetsp:Transcript_4122/g.8987  ORF Transcript_4122/g.8987 Transcript_4122/m.8987 type:complete len:245 (+) Transcript_4122:1039-1773(+)
MHHGCIGLVVTPPPCTSCTSHTGTHMVSDTYWPRLLWKAPCLLGYVQVWYLAQHRYPRSTPSHAALRGARHLHLVTRHRSDHSRPHLPCLRPRTTRYLLHQMLLQLWDSVCLAQLHTCLVLLLAASVCLCCCELLAAVQVHRPVAHAAFAFFCPIALCSTAQAPARPALQLHTDRPHMLHAEELSLEGGYHAWRAGREYRHVHQQVQVGGGTRGDADLVGGGDQGGPPQAVLGRGGLEHDPAFL